MSAAAPRFAVLAITCVALLCAPVLASATAPSFRYVSPMPGSRQVSPRNNLAFRAGPELEASRLAALPLTVNGSQSGPHPGQLHLSRDQRTLLFDPDQPYATGETVSVTLPAGLRTRAGEALPGMSFTFTIAAWDPGHAPRFTSDRLMSGSPLPRLESARHAAQDSSTSLLAKLPPITTTLVQGPATREAYFLAPFQFSPAPGTGNLVITDGFGQPLYESVHREASFAADFKVQPGGRLSAYLEGPNHFIVMDSSYAVIDTVTMGNGYTTDVHELSILPDGHALLMAYDPQPVAMDSVVAGGDPNAIVIGLIVQELDEAHDVIFQWRSWDHFAITDGVSPIATLTGPSVDYVHGNSIERMPDGNLLISSRHMNELTKIDRVTGDVIWRMGLHSAHNDFTFVGDTRGFSHQHDARVLPNGHLTLFDNGNLLQPLHSRAVEYALDESTHVVTLVREFRHTPDIFAGAMGNVRRHEDGSTVIGWGGSFGPAKISDLDADGAVGTELQMPAPWVSYRAFRAPWRTSRLRTTPDEIVLQTTGAVAWDSAEVVARNTWDRPFTVSRVSCPDSSVHVSAPDVTFPMTLAPGESLLVRVSYDGIPAQDTLHTRLYFVQSSDSEYVAQTVEVTGHFIPGLAVRDEAPFRFTSRVAPNPSRAQVRIEYTLASDAEVSLDVFDVTGRRVARWLDARQRAGLHRVDGVTVGLAPGLYHYRLRAGTRTSTGRWVVTR